MTIVKLDELSAYMGGFKVSNEVQRGIIESVILPGVQQDLETHLNRPVEPILVRESIRPDDTGFLWFRHTPIHYIISITAPDGTELPLDQAVSGLVTVLDDDNIRVLDEWGMPELFGYQLTTVPYSGGYFGSINRVFYQVEYVAGYNGYVNEGLKLDLCRIAAREVEMQFDDTMSLRGSSTEAASDSDSRPKGWTDDELRRWDRLRRRTVV